MAKRVYPIIGVILILGIIMMTAACGAKVKETARVAKIVDFSGQVTITKAAENKTFAAFKGMSLTQGDRIETEKDSSLILEIGEDKELRVSEKACFTISELQGGKDSRTESTEISLKSGGVWADVKNKLSPDSRFEIATPTAVMGVRGTKFSVFQSDETSKVAVFEGIVAATKIIETANPDGTINKRSLVIDIKKGEQLDIDEADQTELDLNLQPITPESLNLFTLEIIRDLLPTHPDIVDKYFKNKLNQVIQEKPEADEEEDTVEEEEDTIEEEEDAIAEKVGAFPSGGYNLMAKLPAGYPNDLVPIIPDAQITMGFQEQKDFVITMVVAKDDQEVIGFYRTVMKDAKDLAEFQTGDNFVLAGEKGGYTVALTISSLEENGEKVTHVLIGLSTNTEDSSPVSSNE